MRELITQGFPYWGYRGGEEVPHHPTEYSLNLPYLQKTPLPPVDDPQSFIFFPPKVKSLPFML